MCLENSVYETHVSNPAILSISNILKVKNAAGSTGSLPYKFDICKLVNNVKLVIFAEEQIHNINEGNLTE